MCVCVVVHIFFQKHSPNVAPTPPTPAPVASVVRGLGRKLLLRDSTDVDTTLSGFCFEKKKGEMILRKAKKKRRKLLVREIP